MLGRSETTAPAPSAEAGADIDRIIHWDRESFLHPWQAMTDAPTKRIVFTKGEGIYLYDSAGRRYIDGPGGMWNVQIGHGNEEMAQAIAAQAVALSYASPWSSTSAPAAALAHQLAERSPGDLNTVFFTTGGSSAVDSALRFVHFYNNRRGKPNKKRIISREKSYHGSTYLAASVSGKERDHSFFDTATEMVTILPNINPYVAPEAAKADWCERKVADLENAILAAGSDNVGAFIAEPVLASGGVIVPPLGYHQRTLEICRKYDVLYISDEVVTGFGRLGHWFASEKVFGITPDLITCAKGLTSGYQPLGAVLIADHLIAELKRNGGDDVLFSNGFTYSGHPVCCASALKNIAIMERDGILEHVREVAPLFQQRLGELKRHAIIGDARGIGLVGGIEVDVSLVTEISDEKRLAADKAIGYRIDRRCEENGLLLRPLTNMCVFSPPLCITKDQIETMFDIMDAAVSAVNDEFCKELG